jgi:hypothetical protein
LRQGYDLHSHYGTGALAAPVELPRRPVSIPDAFAKGFVLVLKVVDAGAVVEAGVCHQLFEFPIDVAAPSSPDPAAAIVLPAVLAVSVVVVGVGGVAVVVHQLSAF